MGSPPCTALSLQEISRAKRDPTVMAKELKDAKGHVKFCIEIYRIHLEGRRHFVHEHPEKSSAWEMLELTEFLMHPEIGSVVLHMCGFGLVAEDKKVEALVEKGTRVMSSLGEVLKPVDRRCSSEVGQDPRRHVHLIQGRAGQAQVYPRLSGEQLCEGVAARKRFDSLGLQSRPIMSVRRMQEAVDKSRGNECPSESLHETGGTGMVAFDDVSGQRLDSALMVKARADEIAYFQRRASTKR